MTDSRIKGLYRLGVAKRIARLAELGWLTAADAERLRQGHAMLTAPAADRMVENAIGVFGLPFGVAPNFIVNGREYLVPMAIEEPSVIAALSKAALDARGTGGFTARCDESLLIGQVHISDLADVAAARKRILEKHDELVELGNDVHPRLTARGGGVRGIEVHDIGRNGTLAVHLLVDTCDAMGANLVNTLCETVAPRLAGIAGGAVALRILSNLADRSVVTASVSYAVSDDVRDGVVRASEIAEADRYRAATHNKGIMNGIDAVAVATGNDWRAVEAGAHAYAAGDGGYRPLATWTVGASGTLDGEIRLPLKVGIVGGNRETNPGAVLALQLAGARTATELAELMAAVGLAQNFAALRALATSGIQRGHMKLHARAATGRAVVSAALDIDAADGIAAGKVILLGEHAVVYGSHALALPIHNAVAATLVEGGEETPQVAEFASAIELIRRQLGVTERDFAVRVESRLPLGMGLGASAAYAVAITRAFNNRLGLGLDDDAVNAVAFECEKLAHGTPSGVDNTIATFAEPMLFRKGDRLRIEVVAGTAPLVIACSSQQGRTREQLDAVRERYERHPQHVDAIFDAVDALSRAGADALAAQDYATLGDLMNICQGHLNAIGVSTPELEGMIGIARQAGAAGAKLTGGGGGGSIVAICPDAEERVATALEAAGYRTLRL